MTNPASAQPPENSQLAWALALFNKSILKQDKYRRIEALLGDTQGLTCLDVGSNNGVISWLLRQRGGLWHSADLEDQAVSSIAALVGENTLRLDDQGMPFPDAFFDLVVIIDFLEHVHGDQDVAAELARVIKPGGALIINVPHLKPGSLLNWLRPRLGLTDQLHGHVRPGYDLPGLRVLLEPAFAIETSDAYSKVFSESIDTALGWLYLKLQKGKGRQVGSAKGIVLHQEDREKNAKELKRLSALYPIMWLVSRLDKLLPWASGYKLIIKARRRAGQGA